MARLEVCDRSELRVKSEHLRHCDDESLAWIGDFAIEKRPRMIIRVMGDHEHWPSVHYGGASDTRSVWSLIKLPGFRIHVHYYTS